MSFFKPFVKENKQVLATLQSWEASDLSNIYGARRRYPKLASLKLPTTFTAKAMAQNAFSHAFDNHREHTSSNATRRAQLVEPNLSNLIRQM